MTRFYAVPIAWVLRHLFDAVSAIPHHWYSIAMWFIVLSNLILVVRHLDEPNEGWAVLNLIAGVFVLLLWQHTTLSSSHAKEVAEWAILAGRQSDLLERQNNLIRAYVNPDGAARQ